MNIIFNFIYLSIKFIKLIFITLTKSIFIIFNIDIIQNSFIYLQNIIITNKINKKTKQKWRKY